MGTGAAGTSGAAVIWRRLDHPGHESALLRLRLPESRWELSGAAVFSQRHQACRLDYRVVCDAAWQTLSASVSGSVGSETVDVEISVDSERRWRLNGSECPSVEGCTDLDLNFSPSTNLLPIRRLDLSIGEGAAVRAAWLRFPGFTLEPLEQVYSRLGDGTYRYESAGGRFVAELQVDRAGFVTRYPNLWEIEGGSDR